MGILGVNGSREGRGNGVFATRLPTEHGEFRLYAFPPGQHLALVHGTLDVSQPVLMRLHSECLTGEVFGSLRCDCKAQLHFAQESLRQAGSGVIFYLRQEGRGIGLINKLRAYQLQDSGLDTVEANEHLGLPADGRDYSDAAEMLSYFGIRRARLLTNNPSKVAALQQLGVEVTEQLPVLVGEQAHNAAYLATKRSKMGHLS